MLTLTRLRWGHSERVIHKNNLFAQHGLSFYVILIRDVYKEFKSVIILIDNNICANMECSRFLHQIRPITTSISCTVHNCLGKCTLKINSSSEKENLCDSVI